MIMAIHAMRSIRTLTRLACGASLAVLAASPAWAQDAAAAADEAVASGDEIVVTGFRASLGAALNVKRESVAAVDAIVAEDIAKFPDQNLAESLQRIPGITIQRDGGEGRGITVRGLGSQFTRVRVNGLETVATSTDGASANRDRAFDFNVFASELFSSIVVHKTASAELDEGSLGAVVDLNTGNPLAGKGGFTAALSAQGSYNDLSEKVGPRVAGLLSWVNDAGTLGFAVSAAYSDQKTLELGNNSVRWAQARFDSVDGTPCWTTANSGGTYRPSTACDSVSLAFHPRIPRYGEIAHDKKRLGITGSIQFAPSDATKISLDGLYSSFKHQRRERWAEVLLRSNERSINVSDYEIDADNNLISATLDDAWVRTEHYLRKAKTEFYQVGATWDQDVSDTFRFTLLGGLSKSTASIPLETTIVFDDRDAQDYRYDYSDMKNPLLTFGTSVTNPANFQLAEIRDRPSEVANKFRTAQLRTEWDISDDFTVKAGGVYRRFDFASIAFTRDTVVCGNGGVDRVLGTLACSPSSAFGPAAVYGFPVNPGLADLFTLGKAGQPAGTTTEWLVANLDATTAFTKLYDRVAAVDAGNNRAVREEVTGGYLQFDAKGELGGLRYALNAGVRYVHTDQTSSGLSSGAAVTVERSYEDWLPSMNLALFPHDDIIIRAAVADVMTRPTLGNLTPGGTVDGFNYRINYGNPFLDPFRATAYDIAFEWYFAPQSIFSVALFKKDIASFPVATTTSGTFASTGLPTSIIPPSSPASINPEGQIWTINSIGNGEGAKLKGIEVSLQAPFKFLPGFLSNFGGIVNATYVDSDADYSVAGPSIVPGGANVGAIRNGTLFNLSKRAYNGTLYYDDGKFSARASVSYRSRYADANSGTGNVFEGYGSTINVDASVRYAITDNIEISVEGINLTDEYRYRFTDIDADRNYENNHFGRTFLFGARVKI
ncbi:TonB-dependent receptor [Sphingopyxis sp. H038]|nr:TonB-dependent receptor [Sphingopyxis sp. H012]KTE07764.1 TonB-dependent receptor [Sphingopyxis sp. H053]KTE11583.1 TonB-dependent receptor [Sphingopyxis sp. H093]KTE27494.1 TonB-dependent receptor [Sphingopyxis sp. H080]KTE33843.1 TonB-dependent receptor [Sphingopyxis sp. H038]KTE41686.1 TonB-dependent receptor [Sphingopyxis sp. H005]KTE44462.1 TonB-dependent receptor [Sphingopyxis sp. H077]KTE66947.1 TonB-dependent receptor [Sphingopyxis sp. H085]